MNKDRNVAMLGYEENNSQRRRHSSPNTPNKRVSGNNSSRNTVSSQKNKSVNYKKSRSTSASRIQVNDNRFEYTEGNQKPLKDRWWDDQIRTKKDSNSSIKSNNRGRSRKDEAANDTFEQIRKKDSRVNEFQVSLPKIIKIKIYIINYYGFQFGNFIFLISRFFFVLVTSRLLAATAKWSTKHGYQSAYLNWSTIIRPTREILTRFEDPKAA